MTPEYPPQQPQPPQYGGASSSYMPSYTGMPPAPPSAQPFAQGHLPPPQGGPQSFPPPTQQGHFPSPQGGQQSTYPGGFGNVLPPAGPSPGFAGMPNAPQQPPYPPSGPGVQQPPYQPSYYQPPALQDPLWYLGTAIPDPNAPRAPLTITKVAAYDPSQDFEAIVSSSKTKTKAFNETLVRIFSTRNVFQVDALCDYFLAKIGTPLDTFLSERTSGHFYSALKAIVLGPLGFDAHLLRTSTKGAGTNEKALVEVILGRESSEIRWLITAYQIRYGRSLVNDVSSETSGDTSRMFGMALAAQRPSPLEPVNEALVKEDVGRLRVAAKGMGVDSITFFEILINRSTPHIARVIAEHGIQYKSLSKVIKKEFSGTVRLGLLHIVHRTKPKRDGQGVYRDAKLMEQAMKGFGTDDDALVWRIVRAYWDPSRLQRVKESYLHKYGKALEDRVRGETSGAYRDLLIALIQSNEKK